jgi:ribA/ribD-fused uncharacterized protein
MMQVIDSFSGEYRFLSNFYTAPVKLDGESYLSVEHAYQAAKTFDKDVRRGIKLCGSAGKAKRLGKSIPLRDDWESVKLQIMEDLVYCKFANNSLPRIKLLQTGDAELIEGNNWGDKFWGVCNGEGENHLGKILMAVRNHLNGN